jgi:hypothetical protein
MWRHIYYVFIYICSLPIEKDPLSIETYYLSFRVFIYPSYPEIC